MLLVCNAIKLNNSVLSMGVLVVDLNKFISIVQMDYKQKSALNMNSFISVFLVATLSASLSTVQRYDNTYYVTPNVSMCTNITAPCQEFKTYFNNISYFQSKTEFIFLSGVHLFDLGRVLSVQDIMDIRLVGSHYVTQRSVAENVKEYGFDPYGDDNNTTYLQSSTIILCTNLSGLLFSNVTNLTLANLTILNCGEHSSVTSRIASIHIFSVHNLYMEGMSVQNSTGYGLVGVNVLRQSQILRSSFVGNNQIVKDILQQVSMRNCRNDVAVLYTNNGSLNSSNYIGGNIYLHYNDNLNSAIQTHHILMSFILVALGMDASFSRDASQGNGTGLSLVMDQSSYNVNISISNVVAYRNHAFQGANLYTSVSSAICNVTFTNIFSAYASSISSGVYYSTSFIGSGAPSWFVLKHSTFQCNLKGSSFALEPYSADHSYFSIENCTFSSDESPLVSIYNGMHANLSISNCLFTNMLNSTPELRVVSGPFAIGYFTNSWFHGISITLVPVVTNFQFNHCTFHTADIIALGNGKYVHFIEHNTFIRSTLHCSSADNEVHLDGFSNFTGSKIMLSDSGAIVLENTCYCTFKNSTLNGISSAHIYIDGNNAFMESSIIASRNTKISIKGNNTFSDSVTALGGAIYLTSSSLYFTGNSLFINNTARYGGAIYVDSSSSMSFVSPANVSFINNTAYLTGGAIYVETSTTSNACFYSLKCSDMVRIHLYFKGNYAGDAGSVLHGGNIDTCQIYPSCLYSSTIVFDNITIIGYHDNSTSLISSDSPCIYSCNTSTSPVCLTNGNVSIYPGQTLELTFVTFGQRHGTVPTVIFINSANVVIGVLRTIKQCSSYVIPYVLRNGTQSLVTETSLNSVQLFLNHYLIDQNILPCPVLFIKDDVSSSCICDSLLHKYNLVCNISDVTVINTGNIWIGLASEGVPAFHDHCPFDYCTQNKTINVLDLDSQCSYNRSGVLCGQCQKNLSMTFGTSKCASCSNYHLLLIMVFIIMAVVLVVLLLLFNFTVTNGALNGLLLYANLIRINDIIFFPNRSGYSNFLSTVIAWINLDLGIEVCFYDGMDSIAKTWLQFVFPTSLMGVVLLAARYSSSISTLLRFNAVPVLCMLVLLSYSKILRTIIIIFSPASVQSSPDFLVWQYDGNVKYLGREHLPLFVFGLLVTIFFIIPYSTILLMTSCLQAWSHWRCLQWVNKLKPFLDSYQAPFKERYRYWPGVLLFIRLPLYLVFILSDSTPVKMLSIIFCILFYLCIMAVLSVYKNWSVLLIEMILIANILILSAILATSNNIFAQSRETILNTGISCSLFLMALIVTYPRMKWIIHILFQRNKLPALNTESKPLCNANASEEAIMNYSEYREPLLDGY